VILFMVGAERHHGAPLGGAPQFGAALE